MKQGAVTIFDSGVGGISVLAEALRMLPEEPFYYYADTANAPYGDRPREEVRALVTAHCEQFIADGTKAIILACNTATSAAAESLRAAFDVPILGMEPALKPAVEQTDGLVVVLGTKLTITQEKYCRLLQRFGSEREIVSLACPGLMELVEEDPSSPAAEAYIREVMAPYASDVRGVVLGCTHYSFLKPLFARVLPDARLFDGAQGVCRHLREILSENGITGQEGGLEWDCSENDSAKRDAYLNKCRGLLERCRG